jgi:Tol biopolymer transport system component
MAVTGTRGMWMNIECAAVVRRTAGAVLAILCGCGPALAGDSHTAEPGKGLTKVGDGCFPRWSPDGKRIAFTREVKKKADPLGLGYEVFTMRPDGTAVTCLTRDKAALAGTRWRGQAAWHPGGRYIVFTAETGKYRRKGIGTTARPGMGRNHDIWIMTSDGAKFWKLTGYKENWGAIRPSFSPDGKTLCWNEEFSMEKYPRGRKGDRKMPGDPADAIGHPGSYWGHESKLFRKGEELGAWRIALADVSFEGGRPALSRRRNVTLPVGFTLIEASGFTPDGKGFVCTVANLAENKRRGFWGDVYLVDLKGNLGRRLTRTPLVHDENPEFSPDGRRIVWNTSGRGGDPGEGEELWIMNADGSGKTRLTHFTDPKHPEYNPKARQITESSWSPDSKKVVFGHVVQEKRGGPHIPSRLYVASAAKRR